MGAFFVIDYEQICVFFLWRYVKRQQQQRDRVRSSTYALNMMMVVDGNMIVPAFCVLLNNYG